MKGIFLYNLDPHLTMKDFIIGLIIWEGLTFSLLVMPGSVPTIFKLTVLTDHGTWSSNNFGSGETSRNKTTFEN